MSTSQQPLSRRNQYALIGIAAFLGLAAGWLVCDTQRNNHPTASNDVVLRIGPTIVVRHDLNQQQLFLRPVTYQVGGAKAVKLRDDYKPTDEIWYVQIDDVLVGCVRER